MLAVFSLTVSCADKSGSTPSPVRVSLPADEGWHPGLFMEWWYGNFHLTSTTGKKLDLMAAYFSKGLRILSVSHEERKIFYQQNEFGEIVSAKGPLNVTWTRDGVTDSWYVGADDTYYLKSNGNEITVDLSFKSTRIPLFAGGTGFITWSMGDSYYYSLTRLDVSGRLIVADTAYDVAGLGWMDHQWGDFAVSNNKPWEWFSIQLDDYTDIIAWYIYGYDGKPESNLITIMKPDNTLVSSTELQLATTSTWRSPATGNVYSTGWSFKLPSEGIDLALKATFDEKEIPFQPIYFWEGSINLSGTVHGKPASGKAYAEITRFSK
jgi:predicted secreted hydrolase